MSQMVERVSEVEQRDRGTINLPTWREQSDIRRYSKLTKDPGYCVVSQGELSELDAILRRSIARVHLVGASAGRRRTLETMV